MKTGWQWRAWSVREEVYGKMGAACVATPESGPSSGATYDLFLSNSKLQINSGIRSTVDEILLTSLSLHPQDWIAGATPAAWEP
jgi:hypothetical protein